MLGRKLLVCSINICTARDIDIVIVQKMKNSNSNPKNNNKDKGNKASDDNLLWNCFTNWAVTLEKVMQKKI